VSLLVYCVTVGRYPKKEFCVERFYQIG